MIKEKMTDSITFTCVGAPNVGDTFTWEASQRLQVTNIIEQVKRYELGGETYDEHPGEEPDSEWWVTTVECEPI